MNSRWLELNEHSPPSPVATSGPASPVQSPPPLPEQQVSNNSQSLAPASPVQSPPPLPEQQASNGHEPLASAEPTCAERKAAVGASCPAVGSIWYGTPRNIQNPGPDDFELGIILTAAGIRNRSEIEMDTLWISAYDKKMFRKQLTWPRCQITFNRATLVGGARLQGGGELREWKQHLASFFCRSDADMLVHSAAESLRMETRR